MNRLFTFGCSFTQYKWPTWADILGTAYHHYENWGMMGGGNFYIAASVSEACATRKITKEDTVAIMWTNVMREDRYIDWWKPVGNIHTQFFYDEDFIAKYITERGCYIRDLAVMYSTKKMLDSIGCKYVMTSMVDLNNPNQYENTHMKSPSNIIDAYSEVVDIIKPSIHRVVFKCDWNSRVATPKRFAGDIRDPHPTPKEHLVYIDAVLKDFKVSDSTRAWVDEVDHQIQTHQKISDKFTEHHLLWRNRL